MQARWVGEEVHVTRLHGQTTRLASPNIESDEGLARRTEVSRRNWLATASTVGGLSLLWSCLPEPATAAPPNRVPLDELLYRILRVREATQQETRLIKTGKFKDVQRANVKLAVKFMIENYRLADAFVQASTYLEGGSARRVEAGQVGQGAVQSLYTILEYFDSSDVQNIKVRLRWLCEEEYVAFSGPCPHFHQLTLPMLLTGGLHVRQGGVGSERSGRGEGQHRRIHPLLSQGDRRRRQRPGAGGE